MHHKIRKTGRRNTSRKRSKKCRTRGSIYGYGNRNIIFCVAAVIVTVSVAFFVINIYYYITGNDVTEDNRYPVKGVDVSSYQMDIDWQGLEDEGFKFAFIKATEGSSHVDDSFEYNWDEANDTDIRVGAYHFLSYETNGRKQAENFKKTVDKKWGMLPPAVDVELYGDYLEEPPEEQRLHKILDEFLEAMEDEYGMRPIIYTNTHVYEKYISGHYDGYDIWISAHDIPDNLTDGSEWTFCQYTFHGISDSVANGEKYVDLNVFNGSSWDLRNYDGK